MSVQEILQRVQDAAKKNASGDPVAHNNLLEEIHRLRMAVETPAEKVMRMRFQKLENLCVRLALEYGILQMIAARHGSYVTAAELSKEAGADELLIIRMMSTDLTFQVGAKLIEMKRNHGLYQFPEGPDEKSPFEYAFGMSIFELLQKDQEQKEAFDDYMASRRNPNAPQWFDIYPVEERLNDGPHGCDADTLVVDVGGGIGHEITNFRRKYPDLPGKLVLQDLPETFKAMQSKPEGIQLIEHDFFAEQPIKNARIYYLRSVMHDWSDKKCAIILSRLVDAMNPVSSRILIDDYVLPDTGAGQRAAGMDMLMFLFASGMERTRRQWEALLHSVGLEIVQVWTAEGGVEPVIEARRRG